MGSLHLIRHGETTSNVMRRLDTALPGASLTDFGVRQAVRFGLEQRPDRPVVLVHSQARRATQTAELIASVWDVEPIRVNGIHEVQAGDLEDRIDDEAFEAFRDVTRRWYSGDPDATLPGGESSTQLLSRYIPVVDDLARQYLSATDGDRDVYVVSHGTAIRLVAWHLARIDPEFASTTHLRNTDSIELEYSDGLWICRRWGATAGPFRTTGEELAAAADPMG